MLILGPILCVAGWKLAHAAPGFSNFNVSLAAFGIALGLMAVGGTCFVMGLVTA